MQKQQQWGIKAMQFDHKSEWIFQGDAKFHLRPMLFDTKQLANEYCENLEMCWVEPYPINEDTL